MTRTLTLRNAGLSQTGTFVVADLTVAEIKSVRRRWYRTHKTAFARELAFTAAILGDTRHPCPLCSH